MCMYCAGSCIQLKPLCTCLSVTSAHPRTIVLVHGAWVVRSYVVLTKTRVARNERKVRMGFAVSGMSSPCPGSWMLALNT